MLIPVLDKGYVRRLWVAGDDLTGVNAARASFDEESEWQTFIPGPDGDGAPKQLHLKDERLLNFCAREGHFSVFTHAQVHLEFKLPGMVLDQLIKHRIGISHNDDEAFQSYQNAGDNQKSMRYKEPTDFYVPKVWRGAPANKKQGSEGVVENAQWSPLLEDTINNGRFRYDMLIEDGVAPEQARLFLPYYSMYTNRRWTSSLYGIINFLKLRLEEDAQYEIREYAEAVRKLVQPHFPYTFAAFGLEFYDSRDSTSG